MTKPERLNLEYFNSIKIKPIAIIQCKKSTIETVIDWSKELYEAKKHEHEWIYDGQQAAKRIATGKLSEMIVGHYIKKQFSDWEIGHTSKFTVPDLKPLGIKGGVKSSNYGQVALIKRGETKPQVIVALQNNKYKYEFGDQGLIYGVVSPRIINTNLRDDLVKDHRALDKGKSGFCAYDLCKPFGPSPDELAKVIASLL